MLVDTSANLEFNLCLMDFARLSEMLYASYYFWDTWWQHGDQSEIVMAIIYTIEGWHVGTNLRCYEYAHRIVAAPNPTRLEQSSSTSVNLPYSVFSSLSI